MVKNYRQRRKNASKLLNMPKFSKFSSFEANFWGCKGWDRECLLLQIFHFIHPSGNHFSVLNVVKIVIAG